jgi:hypothetical protein
MTEARRPLAPLGLTVAAVLFLISGPLVGATPDDEEYRSAIISLILHARALLDGVYPYWTSALGFGMPHPLHPALLTHPLMPLFEIIAPDAAVRALYVVHAVVGTIGSWWLIRSLGGGAMAAALASITWALSTPSVNYMLTDLWPAEFVVWSLAPYLFLFALRLLDSEGSRRWLDAIAFGLTAGLMWANGHAGYVPVFFVALAIVFAVHWRRTLSVWPALALAVCVGLAVAGPTLAHLLAEIPRFPPLPRYTARAPVGWPELAEMVTRPVLFYARGSRLVFFGGPLLLLAIAAIAGRFVTSRYRRGLAIAFIVSFASMLLPVERFVPIFSGVFLFRDPMVLCGIALGCLAWDALSRRSPRVAMIVATAQVVVMFASAWPFVNRALGGRPILTRILHRTPATAALRSWIDRLPGRWYLAPEFERQMLDHRFEADGLSLNTWIYSELPVVNGLFKGISADDLYPSEYLAVGRIQGHPATVSSPSALDVLGIGAVVATTTEPVASSLEEVARVPTRGGEVRLLRNPDVWPGAAFVDQFALRTTPRRLPGCTVARLLCLDFTPLTAVAHDPGVDVRRRHGEIDLRFRTDAVAPRWLLVSEMYRPAWTARADGHDLLVTQVLGGLIGVQVPAGVQAVQLRYRPTLLIVLTWVSAATVVFAASLLAVAAANRDRPVSRDLYRSLARYVGYHLPPAARVVEVAPRTPLLVESLARPSIRVLFPAADAAASGSQVLNGWDDLRAFQPDRIILNGTVHYERDIQALLEHLRGACSTDTRLIVAYYSSLWRPALTLGWRFGLTTKGPDQNWVTPSDVANLLRLTGFELITETQHILFPVRIPLLSDLVNRWLAPLPVLRWFALLNLALVRMTPSPLRPPPSVSVVVPARNERGNIANIVDRIPQMGPHDEVIFVEGHSSDGTWEEMQTVLARHPDRRIRALKQPGRGKGDAVRAGFDVATGELLMILDADLTVAPEDLPKFYNALTSGLGEFVNGSRLVYPMEREAMRFANMVGNKFFALAFSYLLGQPLKDTLCGTKALSRHHYRHIAEARLYFGDFDPFGDFDLLFGAAKLGLRFVELPVRYGERTYGTTNIRRWSHGWLLLRMTAFAARKIKFI